MRNKLIYLFAIVLGIAGTACQQNGAVQNVKLETVGDSASYAIGLLVAENNNQQLKSIPGGEEIDIETMAAAFRVSSLGEEGKMTAEEANAVIGRFFEAASERIAQANLEEGNAFLEENKSREGVHVTENGLQYEILTEGTGEIPSAEDKVRVHYEGTLIDGTVFDSSLDSDPAEFGVTQVIPGWTEALQLMPVGSKWKLYIPSNLAYGERAASAEIGPNSVLIFEVELLAIVE